MVNPKRRSLDARYLRGGAPCGGGVRVLRRQEDTPCPKEGEFIKNGKKYLRIVTHDTVRDVIIPQESDVSAVILSKEELEKITAAKEVEGRKVDAVNLVDKNRKEQAAAELRKRELRSYSKFRDMGPKLEQLEIVAKVKANRLLQKAKEVRQEDDDDIKLCNKLILGTKCQAIRDAQLEEKKQIEKELELEEKRLLELMEQDRKKKLIREEQEKLLEAQKREHYVKALNEQLQRNKLEREMEAERQLEESMIIKEAAKKADIDKIKQDEEKKKKLEETRMEINRLNNRILNLAEEERERAKLEDLKLQELMKKKAEEERIAEERHKEERRQREIEVAKMRALQEKSSNEQERRDAERAKRIQEQVEKQWMVKEREAILSKARAIEKLKEERRLQVEERQRAQAKEREKEMMEVARLKIMEEQLQRKEREEQEAERQRKLTYKANLLKQINEKEHQKMEEKKKVFEEGIAEQRDKDIERNSLRALMRRKVAEVKTHNIPEEYIKEVELKLKSRTSAGYP